MRYKPFGATGKQVSELALGTWGIGGAGWDSVEESIKLDAIKSAVELGVNMIDTAPAYNGGVAEQYIGRVLEDMGARKDVMLATKCGTIYNNGQYIRDCSAPTVIRQCEQSLTNLRTDYIDVYLVHWPDANVPMAETMGALKTLQEQGKILHVGASNFTCEQMEEASQYCPIQVYQGQFSMVHNANQAIMTWAQSKGMGVMSYGPLGGGILTGAYRTLTTFAESDSRNRFYQHFKEPMFSKVMALLGEMDKIAAAKKVPLAQIALNYSAQMPFVSTTIVGAQSPKKVEQNVSAFDWNLTDEELAQLNGFIAHCLV